MSLHTAVLLALVAFGAALGAAVPGDFIAKAPAGSGPQAQVLKYYDPLP